MGMFILFANSRIHPRQPSNYLDDLARLVVLDIDGGAIRQHHHDRIGASVGGPMDFRYAADVRIEVAHECEAAGAQSVHSLAGQVQHGDNDVVFRRVDPEVYVMGIRFAVSEGYRESRSQ